MSEEMKKALRGYFRRIRSLLIVRSKESKRFMAEFKASVSDYIEAEGVCDFDLVKEHFGAPETIAKAFLDETQIRYIRRRVRIRTAVIAALLAALLIWAGCVTSLYIEALPGLHGYGIESGPEDPDPNDGFTIRNEV